MASKQEAYDLLVHALYNSSSPAVRAGAAEGLGTIGGEEARAELIKAFNKSSSPEVRAAVARALGQAALR